MARRRVVLQPPMEVPAGATPKQDPQTAIQVGNAKTAVVVLDVYDVGSSGSATLEIETASATPPAPYTAPDSGLWVSPAGASFTISGGGTGAQILSFALLGDLLRWNITSNSFSTNPIDLALTVYLIDN